MPEAIAKYALNSTIGTDDFEPLDKIIKGQKTIIASNTPFMPLVANADQVGYEAGSIIVTFKVNTKGTARLLAKNVETTRDTGYIEVLKNGSELFVEGLTYGQSLELYTRDFSVQRGDVITVKADHRGGLKIYLQDLILCADVIDGSLITIL